VFKRIVVGTDGSDTATEAVRQAVELAKLSGASLEVVSAYEPIPGQRVREEQRGAPGDVQHEIGPREDINMALDDATSLAKAAGLDDVTAQPRDGEPADMILAVAEETGADLIVVGNKGMTGARRFLLGSVPNKVSHHAPCSVIIVRTT
jgi:nucleotide-binding universal stress UspA family protein